MRVDSAPRHLPPTQRTERPEKAAESSTATTTTAPTAVDETPAAASTHHGKGAEHRSAVATLRQYVNHPERHDGPPPEALLASEVKGNGFQRALEAYRASLPPVVETPPVEAPAVETPVVETPAVEPPVGATPGVDTPAVLVPVVEVPAEPLPVADAEPSV